jgi:hypothetical protein
MVELGSFFYGFTMLMHEALPHVPLFTFDRVPAIKMMSRAGKKMSRDRVHAVVETCFNENVFFKYIDVIGGEGSAIVHNLCALPVQKFLYCDNGNKIKEVNLYANWLKVGDMLGIHDWGTEIKREDIDQNILDQFMNHPLNAALKEVGSLSRFFIKVE